MVVVLLVNCGVFWGLVGLVLVLGLWSCWCGGSLLGGGGVGKVRGR